jgi:outer membrane lipoprotein SlyB
MAMRIKILFLVSALFFTGCATQGGWQPTVDTYNDPNAHRIGSDMEDCRYLAKSASGDTARESGKGALIGGAIGAASGAAIGAAVGSAGAGAMIGAAAGGIGGASKQGFGTEEAYKRAYSNCMRNRGHNVIN